MHWNKNSLVVSEDLTEDVWSAILEELNERDDVGLEIENSSVRVKSIQIPRAVSSVRFKSCLFKNIISISGLREGRYFGMVNCRRDFLAGNVTLEKICCRVFSFQCDYEQSSSEDDKDSWSSNCLSITPFIKDSQFNHVDYKSESIAEFVNVLFIDKFFFKPFGDVKDECLYFKNCKFNFGLGMRVNGGSEVSIKFDSCELIDCGLLGHNFMELIVAEETNVKSVEIVNSNLAGLFVNLFKIKVDILKVYNSTIGCLDLNTSSDGEDKYIHRVIVENSSIDYLYLRYREIVQLMSFKGTEFKYPPEFLGTNIPNGSVFPKKEGFISRNGQEDASCYRILRYAMESQRDRHLEGLFFSLEQESVLNEKSGVRRYFSLSYLYLIFSEYGTNYQKPLWLLMFSFILFFIVNAILMSPVISPELSIDWNIVTNALAVTLKQVLQPFSSLKDVTSTSYISDAVDFKIALLGAIHSLIALTCLTFAALAIRWKFKRG
ncbi:TPA: hypothetical protein ACF3XQ_004752 [Vibrio parahaemolyticus]|nr:hypothetical protein [Vibrio parahaemolyticus]